MSAITNLRVSAHTRMLTDDQLLLVKDALPVKMSFDDTVDRNIYRVDPDKIDTPEALEAINILHTLAHNSAIKDEFFAAPKIRDIMCATRAIADELATREDEAFLKPVFNTKSHPIIAKAQEIIKINDTNDANKPKKPILTEPQGEYKPGFLGLTALNP